MIYALVFLAGIALGMVLLPSLRRFWDWVEDFDDADEEFCEGENFYDLPKGQLK